MSIWCSGADDLTLKVRNAIKDNISDIKKSYFCVMESPMPEYNDVKIMLR